MTAAPPEGRRPQSEAMSGAPQGGVPAVMWCGVCHERDAFDCARVDERDSFAPFAGEPCVCPCHDEPLSDYDANDGTEGGR